MITEPRLIEAAHEECKESGGRPGKKFDCFCDSRLFEPEKESCLNLGDDSHSFGRIFPKERIETGCVDVYPSTRYCSCDLNSLGHKQNDILPSHYVEIPVGKDCSYIKEIKDKLKCDRIDSRGEYCYCDKMNRSYLAGDLFTNGHSCESIISSKKDMEDKCGKLGGALSWYSPWSPSNCVCVLERDTFVIPLDGKVTCAQEHLSYIKKNKKKK